MSEINGKTKITDLGNLFPMGSVKRIENHDLNAVLIHVMDDGSLRLSLAINDEKHKDRLIEIANEIMRQGIAP